MKGAAGILSLLGGLLLILIPRFILPVCEFQGYQPMHCSDTARAELYAGFVLAVVGAGILRARHAAAVLVSLLLSVGISATAIILPGIYGYCKSPKMPCNYGTIPSVRLVAAATATIALIATISVLKDLRRKDKT